jgi:hypothetical protein
MPAQDRRDQRVAIRRCGGCSSERDRSRSQRGGGPECLDPGGAFHGAPVLGAFVGDGERPATIDELVEPRGPRRHRPGDHQRNQEIVQFVVIARIRRRLAAHPRDRVRIECGEVARFGGEPATQRDRATAPFLQGRVVEERVRPPVHDLVRERGRLDGVTEADLDLFALDTQHELAQ